MEKIPDLYDGINFNSLPKSIYDELITNSNDRGFTVTKNDKGEAITIDGEYLRPLFMYFSGDYNFYLNLKHYDYLERRLKDGNCFDKDYNKLDVKTIYPFYKYYNDGFLKGYNEFENSLKNNTSLFSITNEQIAFKIYSRVTRNGIIKKNDGNFKLVNDSFSNKEIDEKICKEYGIKLTIKIYEENFFESGFNGGEFYKAWELILNNPTVFEPIFKANVKTETTPEPEPLDLSDTSAVEKIIYLNELGIIDFLRLKTKIGISNGGLASLLSGITGIKPDTIKSSLNRLPKDYKIDNKHPYYTTRTVDKVKKQLRDLGF
jgi:hypothetical protein